MLLGGCALQPGYQRPVDALPAEWHNPVEDAGADLELDRDSWWTLLGDSAIDELVAAGLHDNPSLAEAAARVDQARAPLQGARARRLPGLGYTGGVSASGDTSSADSSDQISASAGLQLSWELDLWGRVRENASAASFRLTARNADAEAVRLALIANIADTALALRTCNLTVLLRDRDIASRETELAIARSRLALGAIAPVVVAGIESNLASARTDRITQEETCRYQVNALVALTGVDGARVAALLAPAPRQDVAEPGHLAQSIAKAPPFAPALPATVLLRHPGVVAAEREVAARWSEIAVARAERLPRIDLAALLTGQWLRVLGSDDLFASGTASAGIAGPLFDGGAGAATVSSAEAAYREAVAQLIAASRNAVRDVEDALAAQQSARARMATTADALTAAAFTLRADEARWRAGAIARYELEESRRQFTRAQDSNLSATSDHARAWVALVRSTGPAWEVAGPDDAATIRITDQ